MLQLGLGPLWRTGWSVSWRQDSATFLGDKTSLFPSQLETTTFLRTSSASDFLQRHLFWGGEQQKSEFERV